MRSAGRKEVRSCDHGRFPPIVVSPYRGVAWRQRRTGHESGHPHGRGYRGAGITLVKGEGLYEACVSGLERRAHIRQNLFFAFIYNALGAPIAAGVLHLSFGVLLSPITASAATAFGSVSVISNALRLWRLEQRC